MPPVDDQVDLDRLLRNAIFSVAVQAYSSGVGISAHVDSRLAEAPADLILMDLQMPGMGVIEAVRRLRAMGGAAAEVPVMALTAYVRYADRKVAMEAGMNAFLAKPIVVAELYDLLHQLLPEK
jgi:CheY-like chemotaxis protein